MAGVRVVSAGVVRDSGKVWSVGERLYWERRKRRKSLRVVAGLAGMGKDTLWRIEQGKRDLDRLSEIVALARALQIPPMALLRALVEQQGQVGRERVCR